MELYATELMGSKAYDAQNNYVGRVREFFVEPADQPNRVSHFLLARGQFPPLRRPPRPDRLRRCRRNSISTSTNAPSHSTNPTKPGWPSSKDLLDQQIIDTSGRKVVRVNDIDLAEQRTNGNVELRVTQVDVGLAGRGSPPAAGLRVRRP